MRDFSFPLLLEAGGRACATEVHRLVCVLSQSYIIFKHDFLLTQRKKLNQQQKQPLQETAFQIHYSRNGGGKKTRNKETKPIQNFQHATLFRGQVSFHRKPPMLLVFVVIKITDVSPGCQQVNQAERNKSGRKTRKPRDIITSPDHAHMTPAASEKTVDHTLTRSRARCQTEHNAGGRLELKREHQLAFKTSGNPHILVVPKRQLWQKCLPLINKRSKTLNSSGTEGVLHRWHSSTRRHTW